MRLTLANQTGTWFVGIKIGQSVLGHRDMIHRQNAGFLSRFIILHSERYFPQISVQSFGIQTTQNLKRTVYLWDWFGPYRESSKRLRKRHRRRFQPIAWKAVVCCIFDTKRPGADSNKAGMTANPLHSLKTSRGLLNQQRPMSWPDQCSRAAMFDDKTCSALEMNACGCR